MSRQDYPDDSAERPAELAELGRFIPFITPLKGERPLSDVVLRPDGLGIAYAEEEPDDRDDRGALWVRTGVPAGRPIPLFRQVHPRRARAAMLDMRCQGCGGEPSRTAKGTLFFTKPEPRRDSRHWPETEYTVHPPTCLLCTHKAMLYCPFVQSAPALRVRHPRPWGVFGVGFRPGDDGALRLDHDAERCSYDDLRNLPWMLALQPVARLSRCTVVDVRAELAAAGLELPARDDHDRSAVA